MDCLTSTKIDERLEIERTRLEIEKSKLKFDQRFSNKYLALIVAAIVPLTALRFYHGSVGIALIIVSQPIIFWSKVRK